LRMYSNGMSVRAISRVLELPLSTVFAWIKRHGKKRFVELVRLWGDARQVASRKVITKVVDGMWTCAGRQRPSTSGSTRASPTLGLYVLFSVGDRDQRAFREVVKCLPEGGG
jgi:hypothetical protein